jgi:hypothetical protein
MSRGLLVGLMAIGINAAALVSAPAQPINGTQAATAVPDANALSGRIRAYHRGPGSWRGSGPPPPGYCGTMRAGEAVLGARAPGKRCDRQPSVWLGAQSAKSGRPAQRRARRGGGGQSRSRLPLRRIPLPGGNAGISCARHRDQGNRPKGACLPPAGGCAIVVVQRASNVHVELPATLMAIEAVPGWPGRYCSKISPAGNVGQQDQWRVDHSA